MRIRKKITTVFCGVLVFLILFTSIPFHVFAGNTPDKMTETAEENFPVNYDPNDGMISYGHVGKIGMRPELDTDNNHYSGGEYISFPKDVAGMLDEEGNRLFPGYDALEPDPYYDYSDMFNKAVEIARAKGDIELFVEEGVYYFTKSVWLDGYFNINGVAGKTAFVVKPHLKNYAGDEVDNWGFFANRNSENYAWYQGKISDLTIVVEGAHEAFVPTNSVDTILENLYSDEVQAVEGYALFHHIRVKYGRIHNIATSGFHAFMRTCFMDMLTRVTNCSVGPTRYVFFGVETNDAFFYDNYFYGGYYTKDELHEIPIFQVTFSMGTTVFSNSYVGNYFFSRSGAGCWCPHTSYSNITFERTYSFVMDTTAESSSSVSGCLFKDCSYNDIEAYFEDLGLKAYDHSKGYWDSEQKKMIYPDTGYIIRDSITYNDNTARKSGANHYNGQSIPMIILHSGIAFSQNKIQCDSLDWTTMLSLTDSGWSSTYDKRRSCGINVNFSDNAFEINDYVKEDLFIDDWKGGKPLSEDWHDNIIIEWGPKGYNDKDGNPVYGYVGVEGDEPVCWMEDHVYVSTDLKRYVDLSAFKSPDVPTNGYLALGKVGADELQLQNEGICEQFYEDITSGDFEIVSFKEDFDGVNWSSASNHLKFQKAFDYIAQNNAILIIEAGTYHIDEPILLRGGATYRVYSEGCIDTNNTDEISGAGAFVMSADDSEPISGYFYNVDLNLHTSNTSGFYQVNTDNFYFKMRSVQRGVGCFTKCNLKDTVISEGQIQYCEYGFFYRTVTDNTVVRYVYGTASSGYEPEEGYVPGDINYKYFISTSDFAHSTWRGCWLEFGQFSNGRTLSGDGNSLYRGNLIDYTYNYSFGRNDVVCGNTMTRADYGQIVNHMLHSNFPIDLPDALTDKPMIMFHVSDGLRLIGNMCIGTMSHQTYFVSFDSHSIRYLDEEGNEVTSISNARVAGNAATTTHLGPYKIKKPISPYDRADDIVLENCKNNSFCLQNFYFVDQEDDVETTDVDETFRITKEEVSAWSVPLTKTYVNGEALVVDYPEKTPKELTQVKEIEDADEVFYAYNEWNGEKKDVSTLLLDFKDRTEEELEALKELFVGYIDKTTVQVYEKSKYNMAVYGEKNDSDATGEISNPDFIEMPEEEQKLLDMSSEEPSEEASEEVSEEPSEEASEEVSEEPSEEASEEVSEEPSEEASEEASEEPSEEASEEASEEPSEEASEEASEEPSEEASEEASEEPSEEASEEPSEEPDEESFENIQEEQIEEKRSFTYWDVKDFTLEERQDIFRQTILYDIKKAPDEEHAFYMKQERDSSAMNSSENCPTYAIVFRDENIAGTNLQEVKASFYQDFCYSYTWSAKRAPVLIFSEDEDNYYGITLGYTADSAGNLGVFYRAARVEKNYDSLKSGRLNNVDQTAAWNDSVAALAIGLKENQTYAYGITQYDSFAEIKRPYNGEQQKTVFGDYTTIPMFEGIGNYYDSMVLGVDYKAQYNDVYKTVTLYATIDFSEIGEDASVNPSLKATTREVLIGTFKVDGYDKIFGIWSGDETWIESVQFTYGNEAEESCNHQYESTLTRDGYCTKNAVVRNTCKLCGNSYEETRKAPGHVFVESIYPLDSNGKVKMVHTCTVCDFAYASEEIVKHQPCVHDWVEVNDLPEVCSHTGYMIRQCRSCGEVSSEEIFFEEETYLAPEGSGSYVRYTCNRCGYNYKEYSDICEEDIPGEEIPEGLWCTEIEPLEYTGKALKPEISVYWYKTLLVKGKDYTVSYKRNTNANAGDIKEEAPTVVIKGKGNYQGSIYKTFVILPKNINDEDVTAEEQVLTYNKKLQKKIPSVLWNKKKLSSKKDFDVMFLSEDSPERKAYLDAGEYEVLLRGKGNYTGECISKIVITEKILLSKASLSYTNKHAYKGGKAVELDDLVVKVKGQILAKGKDYTVEYSNNKEVGTATVVVRGMGIYAGSKKGNFSITGTSLKSAKIEGLYDLTYNGKAQTPYLKISRDGVRLKQDVDYVVSYTNNVNVGKGKVVIKGIGQYTGTINKTFRILPYNLFSWGNTPITGLPRQDETYLYEKGGTKPVPQITFGAYELVAGKDYTIVYSGYAKITDKATMTIVGKGNFTGKRVYKYRIVAGELERVSIFVSDVVYKNKAGNYVSKPVLKDVNGKKLSAGTDYEKKITYMDKEGNVLDSKATCNVGDIIKLSVTGKGKYKGNLEASYRICSSAFNKVKVKVLDQEYTKNAIYLTADDITVTDGDYVLVLGTDYEIVESTYANNVKYGKASVELRGIGEYAGSKKVTFRIKKKSMVWWNLLKILKDNNEISVYTE